MAIKLGGSGGGGGSPFPAMYFQQSMTWTCPVAMEAMVYVIGGGGSGGGSIDYSPNIYGSNGGGAGGCAVSKLTLAAQDYTLTIGSGGAYRNGSGNGSSGGNSSMAGSGMSTMTGNGGGAGQYRGGSTLPAVSGGTATGGNLYNNTGGGVIATTSLNGRFRASGGGGVGLYRAGSNGLYNIELNAAAHTSGDGKTAFGGSPLNANGNGASATSNGEVSNYQNSAKINHDGLIGVELFSGLTRFVSPSIANASTNDESIFLQEVKTGFRGYSVAKTSSIYVTTPAGPLDGGAGNGGFYNRYGASGSCGGGGGSINCEGGRTGWSGAGGSGIIIICPLTIGA